jgi:hypothetical protein
MPRIAPLEQMPNQESLADVQAAVRQSWMSSRARDRIRKGDRVALGVGSRGISQLAVIVKATVDVFREWGAAPFIVAAMGSHGGATEAGQRQILADHGITEEAMGAPVRTDMNAVCIGANSAGQPVYWDKNAWEADAVVTVSRIKAHTDFEAAYESGIVKMLVIGLGKLDGAAQHHRWGVRGLREFMPLSARVILEKARFHAGLAVVENALEKTAIVQVVERDELMEVEPRLLQKAKEIMGRLPFAQLDLLVIGEMGKNYSGAGIDPNVVGRRFMECEPEFSTPRITRICALDLSPESHGNGTGIGLADLATDRLLSAIDPGPTRLNQLTACSLLRSKLPFGFPNDRQCIEAGLATCWQPDQDAIRFAIIPSTLELSHLWVSENLCAECGPELRSTGAAKPIPFDAAGNLIQETLFPHSMRARRGR